MNDNLDGQIDSRLRAAGEQWRAQRPAQQTAVDPLLFSGAERPSRVSVFASLLGLLAVAVIGVLIVLSLPPSNHDVAMGSPSPSPTSSSLTPTLSPGPNTPTPTSTLPTPSVTPTASLALHTPAPPALLSPDPGVVAPWVESTDNGLGLVDEIDGVADANGRYVAVGMAMVASHGIRGWTWGDSGAIWYSTDGLHWQSATMPNSPQLDRVTAVAATATGFAALGPTSDASDVTYVLTSTDGREWQVSGSFPAYATAVTAFGSDLLAYAPHSNTGTSAWASSDGQWTELAINPPILAATAADGYLWTIRSRDSTSGDQHPVELWRSADLVSWQKVTDLPGSKSLSDAQLAVGPRGWAIVGERVTFGAPSSAHYEWFAWASPDGLTWTAANRPPGNATKLVSLLADDFGFVASGIDTGGCCAWDPESAQSIVWFSGDGTSFQQQPKRGWTGRMLGGLLESDGKLIALGSDWKLDSSGSGFAAGAVWTIDRSALTSP